MEIKDGMSRNYNFREKVKKKEQNKMALSCEVMGCQPSVPRMRKNKKGQTYYVQGNTGTYKRFLKKQATKKSRKIDLEEIKSGSHYKKIFDLMWEWY